MPSLPELFSSLSFLLLEFGFVLDMPPGALEPIVTVGNIFRWRLAAKHAPCGPGQEHLVHGRQCRMRLSSSGIRVENGNRAEVHPFVHGSAPSPSRISCRLG